MTLKLHQKQILDYYVGSILVLCLKPFVRLLGWALRRDHSLSPGRDIVFVKLQGGGSLVIAGPSLLAIRKRYPSGRLKLVCTPSVKKFAELLGIFDDFIVLDDSGLAQLTYSTLKALNKFFRVDTIVDLEPYSRMTTVLSAISCARNRIGFYFEDVFWKQGLHTHLVYFNRFAGVFHHYDNIASTLGAEVSADTVEKCRADLRTLTERELQKQPGSISTNIKGRMYVSAHPALNLAVNECYQWHSGSTSSRKR